MTTSRERVLQALEHRGTDRVPADLGSSCNTSITYRAYRNLLSCLVPTDVSGPAGRYARPGHGGNIAHHGFTLTGR